MLELPYQAALGNGTLKSLDESGDEVLRHARPSRFEGREALRNAGVECFGVGDVGSILE